jgi:hypothetical protein
MKLAAFAVFAALAFLEAQELPSQRPLPGPPQTAREQAPIDLTGYWISVVTQDWRWRMLTPRKGDFPGIPLNAAGRKIAEAWDPAVDQAAGNQCKAYGAPGIMRIPGRLHITWEDPSTLRLDADAGTQTRLFHFGASKPRTGEPEWQGDSTAEWDLIRPLRPPHPRGPVQGGGLKVVTTHLRPGYLRKNGVPYSAATTMTEYFDVTEEPNGWHSLLVTTIIEDPQYLTAPVLLNTNFRKLPDATGWNPTPCEAR